MKKNEADLSNFLEKPDPFDTTWHVYISETTYGPYSGEQLREMVGENRLSPTNLTLKRGAHNWVRAEEDPVLQLLFESSARPSTFTAKLGRRINFIATICLLLSIGWLVWPYYAVYDLAMALKKGEESTLQSRVNWDSLRQSLRADLNVSFARSMKDESEMSRGLAMVLGPTLINQLVDGYITPQAVARAVIAKPQIASTNEPPVPVDSDVSRRVRELSIEHLQYAFFAGGPLSFQVEVRPAKGAEIRGVTTLYFKWSGDWSLTRITFPLDEIQQIMDRKPSTASVSNETKTNGPSQFSKIQPKSNATAPIDIIVTWGALFKSQVERCWNKPRGDGASQKFEAVLSVKLKRDGSLETNPIPISNANTSYSRAYQDSALRAIIACQPYRLPAAYFDEWKFFEPVFAERLN